MRKKNEEDGKKTARNVIIMYDVLCGGFMHFLRSLRNVIILKMSRRVKGNKILTLHFL